MEIRTAQPRDTVEVQALLMQLAAAEGSAEETVATVAELEHALFAATAAMVCWVAVDDQTIIGAALCVSSWVASTCEPTLRLLNLVVDEGRRGEGVGRELLVAVVDASAGRVRHVDFMVRRENTRAQRFYESLGAFSRPEWTVWRLESAAATRRTADTVRT